MKLSREIKTAVLVIVSILLFIWGYSFLKGKDLFANYKTFYVEFDDVTGLSKSAPVTLKGLVIGKVNSITINPTTGKLLVRLQITNDFPISKTSTATIYEPGFIGGKQIEIAPDLKNKTLALDGQKLMGNTKLGMASSIEKKIAPLQEKLEKVLLNADKLLTGINTVLDGKTQKDLKNTLSELNQTMKQFHGVATGANNLLNTNKSNFKDVITNFKKTSTNLAQLSDSLKKADLSKTVKNLNNTLIKVDGLMTDLQLGKGSMGKLFKDEGLYTNLKSTSKEMELLLKDVRLYPTRYINVSLFGKKNKPYIAPKTDSIPKAKN